MLNWIKAKNLIKGQGLGKQRPLSIRPYKRKPQRPWAYFRLSDRFIVIKPRLYQTKSHIHNPDIGKRMAAPS